VPAGQARHETGWPPAKTGHQVLMESLAAINLSGTSSTLHSYSRRSISASSAATKASSDHKKTKRPADAGRENRDSRKKTNRKPCAVDTSQQMPGCASCQYRAHP
jgi:hypothetical protein